MIEELSDKQLERYGRHILLDEIGYEGQLTLVKKRVGIIGLGGLGSPVALYLASAGIGELTLVDFDQVELSNLQRQLIHNEQRIGLNKATSAKQSIELLNKDILINTITHRLNDDELAQIIINHDLILDCTDNFASRYQLNQLCYKHNTPLVSGAAIRWEGQISTYDFRKEGLACYQCLFPKKSSSDSINETCSQNGVVAPLLGIIGSIQALEAIKCLLDLPTLNSKLTIIDGLSMQIRQFNLKKDQNCPVCSIQK
ncbi:molybdopterin biosynthesis protein MoeB [Thiomicrospira aerophila AL3]|uniref:Molybdopterin-synthase adenylyltransferase n=1 Tax=Thiomicrospira aerophila AL3 TaxID=717772 RepID=W0DS45_9GAMM|nr:molybdopterin-synthase adenylyltransferase MoeB [Thiomicrospira aerophila]AHF01460.1 molybdopterin biosynthesis protein MoeB [Thiomicrospira aerophila AL3]